MRAFLVLALVVLSGCSGAAATSPPSPSAASPAAASAVPPSAAPSVAVTSAPTAAPSSAAPVTAAPTAAATTAAPTPTRAPTPTAAPPTPSPTVAATAAAQVPLRIVDSGFSQSDAGAVYYGIVVENPNTDWGVFGTGVEITFLDAGGDEVTTLGGLFATLLPGQTSAIGDYSPSAMGAKSMEVKLIEGEAAPIPATPEVLTVTDVETRTAGNQMTTTGTITNSSDQALDFVVVTLIYRDDDDNIIGGWHDITSVPANGETEFEIRALEPLPADTTEVYLSY